MSIEAAVIAAIGNHRRWRPGRRPSVHCDDGVLLDVLAVAFNPVDVAIATGRFYAGYPPLPYVPGIECVAHPAGEVRLVYAQGSGRGISSDGFAAEQVVALARR